MMQKYTPPKKKRRSPLSTNIILEFISIVLTAAALVVAAYFGYLAYLARQPQDSAPQPVSPTSILIETSSPTGIIQPTQPPIMKLTATPQGMMHTILFVASSIPSDVGGHTVYYSLDNGPELVLATAVGASITKTSQKTFSQSIRIWVDVKPGTFLYEELSVDGEIVASGKTDSNGLTYRVGP